MTFCLFLWPGCRPEWYAKSISMKVEIRGVKIPCNRSPERLNFVPRHLIFVGRKYGNYFMLSFWCLEFWGGSWIFRKYVYSRLRYCIKQGQKCFLPYNRDILMIHGSIFIHKCMWALHLKQRYSTTLNIHVRIFITHPLPPKPVTSQSFHSVFVTSSSNGN